jgi:hypothetical protein
MTDDTDYGDEWERQFSDACDKAKADHDRDSGVYLAEIERLALLSDFDYQLERKPAAKRLNGLSVTALDRLVRARRPKDNKDDFALPHWKTEPWSSAVSGADLLDELKAAFKYIYAPPAFGDAAALWVLHAWTIDAGDRRPNAAARLAFLLF